MRFTPLIPLALLALAAPARAETISDAQAWINLTAMGSLKGRLIYFAEVQPRMFDNAERLGQLLIRPAIGWQVSPSLALYQGYAHVVQPIAGGRDVNEERSFQQVSWTVGKIGRGTLSSRTRFEQRWRSDGGDTGFRFREMLRYAHPLRADAKGTKALVYAEAFVAANDTDWGARKGFDQLRSFAGLEIPVKGRTTVEAGYLNQRVNQTRGRIGDNHVASISLFFRH
jgi:hypothetical protein